MDYIDDIDKIDNIDSIDNVDNFNNIDNIDCLDNLDKLDNISTVPEMALSQWLKRLRTSSWKSMVKCTLRNIQFRTNKQKTGNETKIPPRISIDLGPLKTPRAMYLLDPSSVLPCRIDILGIKFLSPKSQTITYNKKLLVWQFF